MLLGKLPASQRCAAAQQTTQYSSRLAESEQAVREVWQKAQADRLGGLKPAIKWDHLPYGSRESVPKIGQVPLMARRVQTTSRGEAWQVIFSYANMGKNFGYSGSDSVFGVPTLLFSRSFWLAVLVSTLPFICSLMHSTSIPLSSSAQNIGTLPHIL